MPSRRTSRLAMVATLVAVGVVVALDLAGGEQTNLTGALAVAPLLAATVATVRQTVAVSVVSAVVGLALLVVSTPPLIATAGRASALLVAAVLAPLIARARIRRETRIRELTRVAEVAQQAVLTPLPPVSRSLAVSARYLSASREALIGGDLYALVETDDGVRLIIGDVRGKGLDAVALAALVISAFREAAHRPDLRDVVRWMDQRVAGHLDDEDFVTALLTDVDDDGSVRVVSCGHPPPVLVHRGHRKVLQSVPATTPFGLSPRPRVHELRLQPEDRLLLYTDGLVETRAADGSFVPVEEVLERLADDEFDEALDDVVARLRHRAQDVRDDLALVLVQYLGAPSPVSDDERGARVIDLTRLPVRRGDRGPSAVTRPRPARGVDPLLDRPPGQSVRTSRPWATTA